MAHVLRASFRFVGLVIIPRRYTVMPIPMFVSFGLASVVKYKKLEGWQFALFGSTCWRGMSFPEYIYRVQSQQPMEQIPLAQTMLY